MKDVELLAQSTARHLASSAALAVAARCIENRQPTTELAKELSNTLRVKAKYEAHAALSIFVAHRSDLELLMSVPPINPS